MKVAVLGTGTVGVALATRLVEVGHEVRMGSRTPDNAAAAGWATQHRGGHGTFAEVAGWGELLVNATSGLVSLAAFSTVTVGDLTGKVVLDVSNPLDFSGGFPPEVRLDGDRSVAEQLQQAYPAARVVKALNTLNADLMGHPERLSEPTNLFLAGDDARAKVTVAELLHRFGWSPESVIDLGGLVAARGLEHYVRFWVDLMAGLGTASFNVRVVR